MAKSGDNLYWFPSIPSILGAWR